VILNRVTTDGQVSFPALAELLRTSKEELARTAGIGLHDPSLNPGTPAGQQRLREMVSILERIDAWHHSPLMAYAWYRDVTLPGFAGQTAEMLVRSGQAQTVLDYLDDLAQGSYA